jgi:hypothetical protein
MGRVAAHEPSNIITRLNSLIALRPSGDIHVRDSDGGGGGGCYILLIVCRHFRH